MSLLFPKHVRKGRVQKITEEERQKERDTEREGVCGCGGGGGVAIDGNFN